MIFQVFALLCVLSIFVRFRLQNFFKVRKALNDLPGPTSYYIIGSLLDIYGDSEEMFKNLRRLASKYKIYRLWCSYIGVVCLTDPEDIEVAISGSVNMQKSRIYDPLLPWLDTGLLTSKGRKWRARRKLLTPSFHFNILQQFVDIFGKQTELLVEELETVCGKGRFNVMPYIGSFTLRTICQTAMGIRFEEEKKLERSYETAIKQMGDMLIHRVTRPWLYVDTIFPLFPTFWKQHYVAGVLHKFSLNIIQKRKSEIDPNETNNNSKRKMAMLDLLLAQGGLIDMNGIREEVDTFVFEGHDTTTAALGFTIMLLANHRDVQDEVYRELVDVFGFSNQPPTYNELQSLTYMEMCIKESLRLYPSVAVVGRRTSQNFRTPSGYLIPKGVEILVQIYDLHHNPDIYPDPEKFDPDRFLPENTANRHPFAYLPFSGGPRNCIGQKFAMAEMKAALAGILRKFIVEPIDTPDTISIMQDFVLRPKNGIHIKLKPRLLI